MRARVAAFLRVLNRAKQEKPETERRTITYVSILLPDGVLANCDAQGADSYPAMSLRDDMQNRVVIILVCIQCP